MEFKRFYNSIEDRKFNTWCKYTKRLDTYGCGCQHNCSYCYSKSLLGFRGLWNPQAPKLANINEIRYRIKTFSRFDVIKLGGMTDCFQPLEYENSLTYETIKLLNYYKIHYLIVTKNSLVSSEKYMSIYDKKLAHFQISVTSTNNAKELNEKASSFNNRVKSIEKLYCNGFDISVRLSPFIPKFIDVSLINSIQCNKILIEFLKVNHWIKKTLNIDYLEYSLKYGGYEHLQLSRKINLVSKLHFEQQSVGEYVKDHHEYFKQHVNFNKNDCCNLNINQMSFKQQTLF